MFLRSTTTTTTTALFAFLTFSTAAPADVVPTDQGRHVSAAAFAGGPCGESGEDMDFDVAPGFDTFDSTVTASASACEVILGEALAGQLSEISGDLISGAAVAIATASGGMVPGLRGGDAESMMTVIFIVTEPTPFEATGLLGVGFDGAPPDALAYVELTGSAGPVFLAFAHPGACGGGSPCEVPLSASGVLDPGEYTLIASAHAAIETPGSPIDLGAHASLEFELLFTGPACPADVTGDGIVSVDDLVAVILAWGSADEAADVNDDGTVDVLDLVDVVLAWGGC